MYANCHKCGGEPALKHGFSLASRGTRSAMLERQHNAKVPYHNHYESDASIAACFQSSLGRREIEASPIRIQMISKEALNSESAERKQMRWRSRLRAHKPLHRALPVRKNLLKLSLFETRLAFQNRTSRTTSKVLFPVAGCP